MATSTPTIAEVDADLLATHEAFFRADRRGDIPEAADLFNKLEALYEQRALIPQQNPSAP